MASTVILRVLRGKPTPPSPSVQQRTQPWWEWRGTFVALILISGLPLLWPDIPPLTDVPGHMGRYRIELDLAHSQYLQRFYEFHWSVIGYLGVDLLVIPLSRLLGLELAVKLVMIAIPLMTVAGFLFVAREVHGRILPTTIFALPFAYNYPFLLGFANFSLSMALVFLALGLWLRLARLGHLRLRAVLFVPISLTIWITHAFGWGALGVLVFSVEFIRQMDRNHRRFIPAAVAAGVHCLPLALPMLLMVLGRTEGGASAETGDWFNFGAKIGSLAMALRDRWIVPDIAALTIVFILLFEGARHPKFEYARNLATAGVILALVFLLLPRIISGGAYADMRLAPYLLAVGVLAIGFRGEPEPATARALAWGGLAFLLARTAAVALSFYLYDASYDRHLKALDHVPRGARLVSFVGASCEQSWFSGRLEHLAGLAIVRREAFSNDQWEMPGGQLFAVHYPAGAGFIMDPSQIVSSVQCDRAPWRTLDEALTEVPRDAFDYIWLIDPPAFRPELAQGLVPVWRDGTSVLYSIKRVIPARRLDQIHG